MNTEFNLNIATVIGDTTMTDEQKALVARLRVLAGLNSRVDSVAMREAADLLEAQAAEIARLREALDWAIAEIENARLREEIALLRNIIARAALAQETQRKEPDQ